MSWATVALGEVAEIERNGIHPEDITAGTRYVGLEHIESGGHSISFSPVINGELSSTKFRFGPQHVLFGKLRPYLAKIACPSFEGICSTDILPILPSSEIDQRYLAYFLRQRQVVDWASARATGINLPRLSPKELARLEIPLPPLNEQRRIAAILDKADALRRKRKRALELLDGLTQSIFLEMFGDPLSNPKCWPFEALGELCDVRDGTHDSPKYVDDGFPLLTSKNFSSGRLDFTGAKLISRADYQSINRRSKVDKGDIVMPMIGTIGSPVLIQEEPAFAIKNVALIKFRKDFPLPEYVLQLLGGKFLTATVSKSGRGGTQKFISLRDMRNLQIPLPPKEEQAKFKHALKFVERDIARLRDSESKLNLVFTSLQSRAFSGQL